MKEVYVTAHKTAARWDLSLRQVRKPCMEGKVHGVFRFGNAWAIPQDAVKPTRTGKPKPGRKPGSSTKPAERLREENIRWT